MKDSENEVNSNLCGGFIDKPNLFDNLFLASLKYSREKKEPINEKIIPEKIFPFLKIGDIVTCIDDSGINNTRIKKGNEYLVTDIQFYEACPLFEKQTFISLDGLKRSWQSWRFIKSEKQLNKK